MARLETVEWVPVPDTRTEGDELLVGFTDDGVVLRNSLVSAGLAVTYADLDKAARFVKGEKD